MAQASTAAITAHDYMAMPEGPPYYQLIDGELFMSPSPNWRHQRYIGTIFRIIANYLDHHDIGRVFIAPLDVILGELDVYQPDVLYFSHARKKILGKRCIEGAPEFIVEALSESTERLDRGRKLKTYARTGVQELWLVAPLTKEILVYDLKKSTTMPTATHRSDAVFMSPLFPGLKFSCAEIFRD